ncbi:glutamine synthetase [Cryobacterium sp. 1639]|nr:glutamine synthetase [Cryobacterium sp. 1639]
MVATLAAAGFEALVGHEIEFVLMDAVSAGTYTAYGVGSLGAQYGFVTDLLEAAAGAGLPIEQVHAEYGQNRFEVSVAPAGPVRAAQPPAQRHGRVRQLAGVAPRPAAGHVVRGCTAAGDWRTGRRP